MANVSLLKSRTGLAVALCATAVIGLAAFAAVDTVDYRSAGARLNGFESQLQAQATAASADYALYAECKELPTTPDVAACVAEAWPDAQTVVGIKMLLLQTEILIAKGAPNADTLRELAAEGVAKGWAVIEDTRAMDLAMDEFHRARLDSSILRLLAIGSEESRSPASIVEVQHQMMKDAEHTLRQL